MAIEPFLWVLKHELCNINIQYKVNTWKKSWGIADRSTSLGMDDPWWWESKSCFWAPPSPALFFLVYYHMNNPKSHASGTMGSAILTPSFLDGLSHSSVFSLLDGLSYSFMLSWLDGQVNLLLLPGLMDRSFFCFLLAWWTGHSSASSWLNELSHSSMPSWPGGQRLYEIINQNKLFLPYVIISYSFTALQKQLKLMHTSDLFYLFTHWRKTRLSPYFSCYEQYCNKPEHWILPIGVAPHLSKLWHTLPSLLTLSWAIFAFVSRQISP